MGRRSDHTRPELEGLFIEEGLRQLSETGLQRFSAREVAKRVGYSIGTLYNVFGSLDGLILAVNARTLARWAAELRARLAACEGDRIAALVEGYFEFAADNPKTWIAIFETRMADGGPAPDWYQALVADLMSVVAGEIAAALPGFDSVAILSLTRSLVAVVHGHCAFAQYRTFDMLGETHPIEVALERVREALDAASAAANQGS
jgi:AcrR family transcriptional regulator